MPLFQYQAHVEPPRIPFDWFVLPSDSFPDRRSPRNDIASLVFLSPPPVLSFDWFVAPIDIRLKKRNEPFTPPVCLFTAEIPAPVVFLEWFVQPLEPELRLKPAPLTGPANVLIEFAPPPAVTVDWFHQNADPPRRPSRSGPSALFDDSFAAPGFPVPPRSAFVQPPFTVHHDEDAQQRSRRNQQQVTSVLNGLLRNGELVGSLTEPALGYKADNPLQWAGAGDGDPKTLHDVIERFLAALNGLGIKP